MIKQANVENPTTSWAEWMADREIWLLAPAVAVAMFKAAWAPWALGLCGALWIIRWAGRGHLTVRTPLDKPVILLLLMIPVTLWATTDQETTLSSIMRLLAGIALYYGIVNWARRDVQIALLGLGISALGLTLALLAPFLVGWFATKKQFLGIPASLYAYMPTLVTDTVHPNMMAGALVMMLPFSLALFVISVVDPWNVGKAAARSWKLVLNARWLQLLVHGLACLAMGMILFLTKSRGGWMAAAAAAFLILTRYWKPLLGLIALLPLGVGWLAWQDRLGVVLDAMATSGTVSGLDGRLEVWSRAIYMIQDFPFTGIGVGTFQRVANALYPFFLAGPDAEISHAHNLLLQVGVDLGIPGLVAFLAILMLVIWSALRSLSYYQRRGQRFMASIAWAGLVSVIAMMIHGLVDATIWIIGRGAFVPFLAFGMLIALERRPEITLAASADEAPQRRSRPRHRAWVALAITAVLGAGVYLGLHAWRGEQADYPRQTLRVPLYPDARNSSVRTESPPADADWESLLEVATFTTTQPLTDVVAFYQRTLPREGWATDLEAGDAESWSGIYTKDEGYAVCLLNVFRMEEEIWTSIVCGDKTQPVDVPGLSALPTPTATGP